MLKLLTYLIPVLIIQSIFAEKVSIQLQNGGSVSGELLKKNAEYLFVDLGFEILKVLFNIDIRCLNNDFPKNLECFRRLDIPKSLYRL